MIGSNDKHTDVAATAHIMVNNYLYLKVLLFLSSYWTLFVDAAGDTEGDTCEELCAYSDYAKDADCMFRNLTAIPPGCVEAQALDASYNGLTSLTGSTFGPLGSLLYLYLQENKIGTIGAGALLPFRNSLVLLNLSSNRIQGLSDNTFVNMTSLEYLILCDNQISDISQGAFKRIPKLHQLFLNDNRIIVLRIATFEGMHRLTELHLQNNLLQRFDVDLVGSLDNLHKLFLHNNSIHEIVGASWEWRTNLSVINMSWNDLDAIECSSLRNFAGLERLYLVDNELTRLGDDCSPLNFSRMVLSRNRLRCDCDLRSYGEWLQSDPTLTSPVCRSPESEAGTEVRSIDFRDCPQNDGTPPSTNGREPVLRPSGEPVTRPSRGEPVTPPSGGEPVIRPSGWRSARPPHEVTWILGGPHNDPQSDQHDRQGILDNINSGNYYELIIIVLSVVICLLLIAGLLIMKRRTAPSEEKEKRSKTGSSLFPLYEDIPADCVPAGRIPADCVPTGRIPADCISTGYIPAGCIPACTDAHSARLSSTETDSSEAPMLPPSPRPEPTRGQTPGDDFDEMTITCNPYNAASCAACVQQNLRNTELHCYENYIAPTGSGMGYVQEFSFHGPIIRPSMGGQPELNSVRQQQQQHMILIPPIEQLHSILSTRDSSIIMFPRSKHPPPPDVPFTKHTTTPAHCSSNYIPHVTMQTCTVSNA